MQKETGTDMQPIGMEVPENISKDMRLPMGVTTICRCAAGLLMYSMWMDMSPL